MSRQHLHSSLQMNLFPHARRRTPFTSWPPLIGTIRLLWPPNNSARASREGGRGQVDLLHQPRLFFGAPPAATSEVIDRPRPASLGPLAGDALGVRGGLSCGHKRANQSDNGWARTEGKREQEGKLAEATHPHTFTGPSTHIHTFKSSPPHIHTFKGSPPHIHTFKGPHTHIHTFKGPWERARVVPETSKERAKREHAYAPQDRHVRAGMTSVLHADRGHAHAACTCACSCMR